MYLKHLVCKDGRIAVVDPELNRVAFHVTEPEAEAWIESGKILAVGTRRRILALHWAGPKLTARQCPELREFLQGGPDIRKKTRYSHDRDTQFNIEKVWTHSLGGLDPGGEDIPESLRAIFLAVAASCGGVKLIRRKRT